MDGAFDPQAILACTSEGWSPSIGDPTTLAWLITTAYLLAAVACIGAFGVRRRDARFWFWLGVFVLFLSLNKQLDLQAAMKVAGRCLAEAQGWYGARRVVQETFLIGLMAGSVTILGLLLVRLRHRLRRLGPAAIGLFFLLSFIAIRASTFNGFEDLLDERIFGTIFNAGMELTGIALILANALFAIRRRRPKATPQT